MSCLELMGIGPGERVAVIGAGGKSALIDRLADEAADRGALIAPTTRIALAQVRRRPGVAYLGRIDGEKWVAAPPARIEAAARGRALTLMEADGSRGLPLKGWAAHEPAVPAFATMTIGVVSARAVGLPATGAHVHRLPLFLRQCALAEGDAVDEAALARMALWCMDRFSVGRRAVFINQADDAALDAVARRVARRLAGFGGAVWIGSMKEGAAWSVD